MRRIAWIGLAVALLALAGWLAARPRAAGDGAPGGGAVAAPRRGLFRLDGGRLPNVVLVTVDTLRADHVIDAAGTTRGMTPALDALAQRGTQFLRTMAPAPATRPALAGLHTGSYVHRHTVASNFGAIPSAVPTIATLLQQAGYATAAFYCNQVLKPVSGFDHGYETYTTFVEPKGFIRDAVGVDMALAWITARPRAPWFLWLHLMSPHGPYNSAPRSPIAAQIADPLPDVDLTPSTSNYGLGPIIPKYQIMQVPPRSAAYRRRYRDEVIFVDAQIGRFLAGLETAGEGASTLVVFTADHGESLGENDYFFQHGWLQNEPSVHVPMIWSQPGRVAAGHRVAATTSLVDVLPTLLAGLDLAAPRLDGRDLTAGLAGSELPQAVTFGLTAYPNQVTAAMRGVWKLVHTPPPPRPLPADHWHDFYPEAESWVLHDLGADPLETSDASAAAPRELAELRQALAAWERANGLPSGTRGIAPVDEESLQRLRALGYAD